MRTIADDRTTRSSSEFASLQTRLRSLGPATSSQAPAGTQRPSRTSGSGRRALANVEPPSGQYRQVESDLVRLAVPANWQQDTTEGHLTFAPPGAVYQQQGASTFTHGIQIGTIRTQSQQLQQATSELLQLFTRSNPDVRSEGTRPDTSFRRESLTTQLTNVSPATGDRERVTLTTMQLRDGSLLYLLAVVPQGEAANYEPSFRRVRQSFEILDGAAPRR